MLVKGINKLKKKEEEAPAAPTGPNTHYVFVKGFYPDSHKVNRFYISGYVSKLDTVAYLKGFFCKDKEA